MIKHLQRLDTLLDSRILSSRYYPFKGHFFAPCPNLHSYQTEKVGDREKGRKVQDGEKGERYQKRGKGTPLWSFNVQGVILQLPRLQSVSTSLVDSSRKPAGVPQASPRPHFQVSVVVKWLCLLICLFKHSKFCYKEWWSQRMH